MPRVRPRTSWAPLADLSQTPACMAAFLSVSRRAREMISAITSSTTLRVLENGALKTTVPRSAAAARSIWLVPMQKAPTASRSGAASSTAWVHGGLGADAEQLNPAQSSDQLVSSSAPVSDSTAMPRSVSSRTPSGWMFSSRRAFMASSSLVGSCVAAQQCRKAAPASRRFLTGSTVGARSR